MTDKDDVVVSEPDSGAAAPAGGGATRGHRQQRGREAPPCAPCPAGWLARPVPGLRRARVPRLHLPPSRGEGCKGRTGSASLRAGGDGARSGMGKWDITAPEGGPDHGMAHWELDLGGPGARNRVVLPQRRDGVRQGGTRITRHPWGAAIEGDRRIAQRTRGGGRAGTGRCRAGHSVPAPRLLSGGMPWTGRQAEQTSVSERRATCIR